MNEQTTIQCSDFNSLVDRYLKEEDLNEETREAFEMHYFECDLCFTELKLRERLYSKEIPVVLTGSKKPLFILQWKPLMAAASLILVVLVSWFALNTGNQSQLLYNLSQVDPPVYIESETRNPQLLQTISSAMTMYSQQKYAGALEMLEKIEPQQRPPKAVFYSGICYLQTENPEAAVKQFDIIIAGMDASYYDEAIYYKGIALMRHGKKDDARHQFQHLASMFSPLSKKAELMMEEIDKL